MYVDDTIEMQLLLLAVAIIFITISSNFRTSDEFEFFEFYSILHNNMVAVPRLYVLGIVNNRNFLVEHTTKQRLKRFGNVS